MKVRSIPIAIILSIVTCGIYAIYWFICMTDDIRQITNTPEDTSGGLSFLLSLVTCGIYQLYWYYKMGDKLDLYRTSRGYPHNSTGLVCLALAIFGLGIVSYCIIQHEINLTIQG